MGVTLMRYPAPEGTRFSGDAHIVAEGAPIRVAGRSIGTVTRVEVVDDGEALMLTLAIEEPPA